MVTEKLPSYIETILETAITNHDEDYWETIQKPCGCIVNVNTYWDEERKEWNICEYNTIISEEGFRETLVHDGYYKWVVSVIRDNNGLIFRFIDYESIEGVE